MVRSRLELLRALVEHDASGVASTPARLAADVGCSEPSACAGLAWLEANGLVHHGPAETGARVLLAGRQYLALDGRVSPQVLGFLAHTVGDLYARDALLRAGYSVAGDFRTALREGTGTAYARTLVPGAFAAAVDHRAAVKLFGAAVVLLARLAAEQPAASVAEEVIAVALLDEAVWWLEIALERGVLDGQGVVVAEAELYGLFALVRPEVLALYEMNEPSDAALAAPPDLQFENWFGRHPVVG